MLKKRDVHPSKKKPKWKYEYSDRSQDKEAQYSNSDCRVLVGGKQARTIQVRSTSEAKSTKMSVRVYFYKDPNFSLDHSCLNPSLKVDY